MKSFRPSLKDTVLAGIINVLLAFMIVQIGTFGNYLVFIYLLLLVYSMYVFNDIFLTKVELYDDKITMGKRTIYYKDIDLFYVGSNFGRYNLVISDGKETIKVSSINTGFNAVMDKVSEYKKHFDTNKNFTRENINNDSSKTAIMMIGIILIEILLIVMEYMNK